MDREPEELQFLGIYGIYKEAFKIILSLQKIFSKITLTLVLPLSFILLAQIPISEFLMSKLLHHKVALHHTRSGSIRYDSISSEWITFWLFKATYHLFLLILSLLTTSAIVYTIACLYTSKDITFKKVMSVVPKVWKRLMVTFLCNFFINLGYNFLFVVIIISWFHMVGDTGFLETMIVFAILYVIGFVYINVIWHLACVVSVLEDVYGIQAMTKSKALIKGKMWVASAIFVMLHISFVAIQVAFHKLVIHDKSGGVLSRVSYGIVCFLLLAMLIHLGLVIQTVIYFVCKAYHHENIDKSCLADHLQVYLGDYVPLKGKNVQLEQFYV